VVLVLTLHIFLEVEVEVVLVVMALMVEQAEVLLQVPAGLEYHHQLQELQQHTVLEDLELQQMDQMAVQVPLAAVEVVVMAQELLALLFYPYQQLYIPE
jgi:hypothetical protein